MFFVLLGPFPFVDQARPPLKKVTAFLLEDIALVHTKYGSCTDTLHCSGCKLMLHRSLESRVTNWLWPVCIWSHRDALVPTRCHTTKSPAGHPSLSSANAGCQVFPCGVPCVGGTVIWPVAQVLSQPIKLLVTEELLLQPKHRDTGNQGSQ